MFMNDIKEEVEEMKKEVQGIKKIKEDLTYLNLISLLKTICVLWFLSIVLIFSGILIFLNQYDFETVTTTTYTQDADTEGDNSNINQNIGGSING